MMLPEMLAPIAIVGANGMLGAAVRRVAARRMPYATVLAFGHPDLDIASRDSVQACAELRHARLIINCAGYTNVEKAEEEEALATRVNGDGVENLARLARETNAFLIHISTDYVFSGERRTPYPPDATPAPLSAYGRSKRAGEEALFAHGGAVCLVRTSWLFGLEGKNFVETILARARAGEPLAVVDDQFGSPTFADDLADALLDLAAVGAVGIFHCTNSGVTTWHAFATEILRQAGLSLPVEAISTGDAEKRFRLRARRPAYSALDCSSTEAILGRAMRPWPVALAAYLSIRS